MRVCEDHRYRRWTPMDSQGLEVLSCGLLRCSILGPGLLSRASYRYVGSPGDVSRIHPCMAITSKSFTYFVAVISTSGSEKLCMSVTWKLGVFLGENHRPVRHLGVLLGFMTHVVAYGHAHLAIVAKRRGCRCSRAFLYVVALMPVLPPSASVWTFRGLTTL